MEQNDKKNQRNSDYEKWLDNVCKIIIQDDISSFKETMGNKDFKADYNGLETIFFGYCTNNFESFESKILNTDYVIRACCKTDFETKDWSLLKFASAVGAGNIVKFLLEQGSLPNSEQFESFTPLHCAAAIESVECVELLLAAGADTTAETEIVYETPLDIALKTGNKEVIKLLKK